MGSPSGQGSHEGHCGGVADLLRVRHKHDNEQHPPSQGKDDASLCVLVSQRPVTFGATPVAPFMI